MNLPPGVIAEDPATLVPPERSSGTRSARTWSIGTLTYTSAGLVALFCWLLFGDFSWNLKERAAGPVAQLMLKGLGSSDLLVGLLVGSLPGALGMMIGPFISVKSDRYRGRWGRRIPFLVIPTPFVVLGMAGLAFTPALGRILHESLGARSPGLSTVSLGVFILAWTCFEMATVVANTIFSALINDVVPHELIGRFFGLFRAVSLVSGIVFNFWLIGYAEAHYTAIFLGLGAVYGVGFTLMCLKVKEGVLPPVSVRDERAPARMDSLKAYCRECYGNPYYLWVFAAITFGLLAQGPVNAFSVFYAQSVGMSMADYGKYVALTYGVSLVLSYPLGALADRFHPLRLGIVVIGLYTVTMLLAGIWATTAGSFAFFFVIHGVLAGSYLTVASSLQPRLFPKAKFAQFYSACGLCGGIGYVILPPLVGAVLDWSGHVYRYTFLGGSLLGVLGLVGFLGAYRKFLRLGGHLNYMPPEATS